MSFHKKGFKEFKKKRKISFELTNDKKIISYHFSLPKKLSQESIDNLKKLTLPQGSMKGQLHECLHYDSSEAVDGIVLTAEHKRFGIIGWALIFQSYYSGIYRYNRNTTTPIYLFVHSNYRRKSIGTNLLSLGTKIIKKYLKSKSDVYPHDTRSTKFFDKVHFKK